MRRERPVLLHARVGVVVALIAGALALVAPPISAVDFYRWVDDHGRVHYSNVPSEVPAGKAANRVSMKEGPISSGRARPGAGTTADVETEGELEVDGTGPARVPARSSGGREKSSQRPSARVSISRSDLRRQLDEATAEVREIDQKLDALAKVRMQHANKPHPSVGGLRATGAADVRSPEEEALAKEREAAMKRVEDIQARLAALPTK